MMEEGREAERGGLISGTSIVGGWVDGNMRCEEQRRR